jgi:hypothetical protein
LPVTSDQALDFQWAEPILASAFLDWHAAGTDNGHEPRPPVLVAPQPFETASMSRVDALVTVAPVDTSMMLLPQLKAA